AAELAAEGALPASRGLHMQVYLAPRNQGRLRRLLRDQHDPASPDYRRWLSAAEYERRFGPTQQDVDEVTAWLAGEGFRVTFASASQGRVAFTGDAATTGR